MYQKVAADKRIGKKSTIYRNYLGQYMTDNGITIVKLSRISTVSETTIKNIRKHRQEPMKYTSHMLCKALKVDVSVLFPGTEVVSHARYWCGRKYVRAS